MKYLFALLFLIFYFSTETYAQTSDTTNMVTVETNNKQFFVGELINITPDSIFINHIDFGPMVFDRKDIKTVHNGMLSPHFDDIPNASVPYYVQTALPNGRGNHYYKNYYIFGNEFNFGLTDNFNLALGFETASLIFSGGDAAPLLQVGAKYSLSTSDLFHAGMSVKYYFNNEGNALMASIPFTYGSKRTNLTVAPNYLYSDGLGNIGIFSNLSLSLSFKTRFVIDFFYIDNTTIFAPNFEFLFNSGFSLSVGGIIAGGIGIPSLSFSIPFGKWKKKVMK